MILFFGLIGLTLGVQNVTIAIEMCMCGDVKWHRARDFATELATIFDSYQDEINYTVVQFAENFNQGKNFENIFMEVDLIYPGAVSVKKSQNYSMSRFCFSFSILHDSLSLNEKVFIWQRGRCLTNLRVLIGGYQIMQIEKTET
jgi:hypothetical protein